MPALSMFFGIIVRMQSEPNGKHHKAHIHALYGDDEIVIALDGDILAGQFPKKQLKMLEGWRRFTKMNFWPIGKCFLPVTDISKLIL